MRELGPDQVVLDRSDLEQILRQLADEVLAIQWPDGEIGAEPPWLVAISQGGVAVARELAAVLSIDQGRRPPLGTLQVGPLETARPAATELAGPVATDLPGDVSGQRLLLVDDVLSSAWNIHAAVSAVLALGQPAALRVAVLIDRGGRRAPMQAAAVGFVATDAGERRLSLRVDAQGHLSEVVLMA